MPKARSHPKEDTMSKLISAILVAIAFVFSSSAFAGDRNQLRDLVIGVVVLSAAAPVAEATGDRIACEINPRRCAPPVVVYDRSERFCNTRPLVVGDLVYQDRCDGNGPVVVYSAAIRRW